MSGERGPLSTPIDLNERRGNPGRRPPKRSAQEGEQVKAPPKPKWVQGEAAREWNRTVRLLKQSRRIAETDRAVLAEYCVTWARWVDVEQHLDDGYLGFGSMGQVTQSPLFAVWMQLNARLEALSKALGLHINARVRLPAADAGKKESELEKLMGGRQRASS